MPIHAFAADRLCRRRPVTGRVEPAPVYPPAIRAAIPSGISHAACYCQHRFKAIPRRASAGGRCLTVLDRTGRKRHGRNARIYLSRRPDPGVRSAALCCIPRIDFAGIQARAPDRTIQAALAVLATLSRCFIGALRWAESARMRRPAQDRPAFRYNLFGRSSIRTLLDHRRRRHEALLVRAPARAGHRHLFVLSIARSAYRAGRHRGGSLRGATNWSPPRGPAGLAAGRHRALAVGLGFLLDRPAVVAMASGAVAARHIHACAVIANNVIFNRASGFFKPQDSRCRSRDDGVMSGAPCSRSRRRPLQAAVSVGRPSCHSPCCDLDRRLGLARSDHMVAFAMPPVAGRRHVVSLLFGCGILHRRSLRRPGVDLEQREGGGSDTMIEGTSTTTTQACGALIAARRAPAIRQRLRDLAAHLAAMLITAGAWSPLSRRARKR